MHDLLSPMKSKWLYLTSHWKLGGLVLHLIHGCALLCALGAVALMACADQLSRNLTDILQLLEAFQRIISRLGINSTCHTEESLFKPRIHLSIWATFYLAGSALCTVSMQHKKYFMFCMFFSIIILSNVTKILEQYQIYTVIVCS